MSDYLFATPSLWEGIARNIDLFGTLNEYNFSNSPREADIRAHQNDIICLRKDMENAMTEVLEGNKSKERKKNE